MRNVTINLDRHFLEMAALSLTAAQFSMTGREDARASKTNLADLSMMKPGTNTPFGPLKQINVGLLNVGYAETDPAAGRAVILLHGWLYDIHSQVALRRCRLAEMRTNKGDPLWKPKTTQ